jgi:DNA-directed DNA polymerase III PolC
MYVNCHTGFSFKYGTLPVRTLFEEAKRCNVQKLVLTEINNTASYMEMLRICSKARRDNATAKNGDNPFQLDIAVGIEFRQQNKLLYIAIARNNKGFEAINRFYSRYNREGKEFPERAPEFENVIVIYPYEKIAPELLRPWEYAGVRKQQLNTYTLDRSRLQFPGKYVALYPVTFLPPEKQGSKLVYRDHNTHRLLRCIALNTILSKLPKHEEADKDEYMLPENELCQVFEKHPELIDAANRIVAQCSIECEPGLDRNKKFSKGSLEKDIEFLRSETRKGYSRIYGENDRIWNERIEKELALIARKNFTSYYLITYDLITYAKNRGFDFVGRGSGANSTVAYCLGITNVDPIELNLYFERFLNEERTSPPDFDIDFSWDNRDDIYRFLFETYGHDHVCLLGTHVTYQGRSILRELGKVFGLPKEEIDELVENRKKETSRDHIWKLIHVYAKYIISKELPSNMSIHAGGVLITEEPIYQYTATEFPPKSLPVSHFEMHNAEDFGIYKFDILSQRGLGHIKETVRHVKRNLGIDVDIYQFKEFKEDEKIKELMRNSKTMGCFYVESPAMRMLLAKLRCDDYLTLVAASSIIRPGVASSGMMKAYIERFHAVKNGGSYDVIHPKMQELMAETYGVMVYQEDVIKVAHEFAGLTLTEADILRRGMSGKYRSREEFQGVKDQFFQNCKRLNYPPNVVDRVWYEIESFSGYSFAKGHSASYAVESYQSLFLKAYYPLEFMVGVINNFGGFYKTEFYFHEARMNGAIIEAPCLNHSEHLTTIVGTTIYIGLVHIKSLESKVAHAIINERVSHGDFKSLNNFLDRVQLGLEQTRVLIRIGAFRFTGKGKQTLLWEAMLHFSQMKHRTPSTALFDTEPTEFPLPLLQRNELEDAFDELELLGFPLCDPFLLLEQGSACGVPANELARRTGQSIQIVGYVVTTKDTGTRKGELMHFGTFYDQRGEVFDTVHFPEIARRYPFRGRGFYQIHGRVVNDFGIPVIEVSHMDKLPMINKRAEEFMKELPRQEFYQQV